MELRLIHKGEIVARRSAPSLRLTTEVAGRGYYQRSVLTIRHGVSGRRLATYDDTWWVIGNKSTDQLVIVEEPTA